MQIPQGFVEQVPILYGDKGEAWLRKLPALLEACESRFGIQIDEPFSDLSWNLLMKANLPDKSPVVLKLGPATSELMKEAKILRCYAGYGAVRVMDADADIGALVLERITPGNPMSEMEDDNDATEVFCEVFQQLHQRPFEESSSLPPLQENFVAIARYQRRFRTSDGPLPTAWVQRAEEYLQALFASTVDKVLLHGDLHHDNILQRQDGSFAIIDPKGWIGDAHFDTIQYLLNYDTRGGDADTVLLRRIQLMSQRLGLSASRIAMWGVARGVLEACWALEDSIGEVDAATGIEISERFARILQTLTDG